MTGEPFFWGMPKLADPHWDRLWAMTQEAGLSVNFHIGSGDMSIFERAYEGAGEHANYAGFGVQFGIGNVSVSMKRVALRATVEVVSDQLGRRLQDS